MKQLSKIFVMLLAMLMTINAFGGFPAEKVFAEEWDQEDLAAMDHVLGFTDDQSIYTDEEFYGQYDEKNQTWMQPGYLAYDKYEGLNPVRDAAMKGDYAAAKRELLEFHRDIYQQYTPAYTSATPTVRQLYSAYATKNNFQLNYYMVPAIWGIPTLTGNWQEIEIDITDRMSSILAKDEPVVSTELFGLKKDGTSLEFESINAGGAHPPVVEVTSKGVVQTIVATDDATISPEDNSMTNYGSEPVLRAEESESSIGLSRLADSNTKRSLIKFDFSAIDAETTPTRAVLKLYGRNASGRGSGELLAIEYSYNTWDEASVTFYEGRPGTAMEHATFSNYGQESFLFDGGTAPAMDFGKDVFAYRYPEELLRFTWASVLGDLYAYDRDEVYALTLFDQWVGYLEQRGSEPRYSKTLDAHVRDEYITKLLCLMIDSEYLTPDLWSATMKYYQMEARAQIDGGNDAGNWGVYQMSGMTSVATYAPELKIYDELIEVLRTWEKQKLDDAFYPDGSAHEIEWSYAFVSTFMQMVDTDRILKFGITDDSLFPDTAREQGAAIMKYFASMLLPGGGNPQVGDGAGYTLKHYEGKTRNRTLSAAFDIPFWNWLASDGKEGEAPDWTTVRFTGSSDPDEFLTGVYISRNNWSDKGLYLYTDVDGNMTPGHGHQDDNQAIIKAYGQYLLVDNSFQSYAAGRIPLDSTMYHNTVTVDEQTQSMQHTAYDDAFGGQPKKEKRYETNYLYDNLTLMTPQNYEFFGLHTRNTLFNRTGGFWIVNDYLEPKDTERHKFWQHWHMLPAAKPTMTDGGIGRSNFADTANVQVAQAGMDDVSASVQNGYFGGGTGAVYDSHYLRYEKTAAGNTTFNTVIYPECPGETADVETYEYPLSDVSDEGAAAMHIGITSDAGTYVNADYYLLHDPAQQAERTFGAYQTDGRSAYVNRNVSGDVSEVYLQDTTQIKDVNNGIILFQSKTPVTELGYKKEGAKLILSSSKEVAPEDLTIYMEKVADIRQVELNGQNVSFKTAGRYLYFGAAPILTDPDYNPNPNGGGTSPGGGGSGGGGGHASNAGSSGGSSLPTPTPTPTTEPQNPTVKIPDAYLKEIENHWGTEELKKAVTDEILQGLDESTLGLDETVTRAQFVTLLVRAMKLELTEEKDSTFYDVAPDRWYAPYVQTAYAAGLIDGIGDGIFAPEQPILREEMAKLLALAHQKLCGINEITASPADYADDAEIADWARPYVDYVREYQILRGDADNRFSPKDNATRAEAAVAVLRTGSAETGK